MRVKGRAILESLTDEATPLRLTLLVVLLRPPGEGTLRGLTWLVAGLALVVPPLARSAPTWLALAGLVLARLVLEWPLSDNHIYLLGYWSLGLGLCLLAPSPFAAIAAMSRWLLGAAFLCAVLWKALLAPDFLDARFFRVTLIADERFADLARTVGGLTDSQLDANRAALAALPAGVDVIDGPVLVEPPALRRLGLMLTWGGLLLETLVALTFLSPRPAVLHRGRHVALLTFAGVTYAIAPVAGFGWLLTAMGLAGCERDRRALRLAYIGVFALVMTYAETPLVPYVLAALSVGLG
jgi:hypothetical protein